MPETHTPKNRKPVFHAIIAGLFNGLFLILAFPPFSFWGFAFLIPFPLSLLARSTKLSPSRAAFWAGLGCSPGWIYTHMWVSEVSIAGIIPLVILLSFYTFLFVWIATHLVRRYGHEIFVLPIAWVGVEVFRGSVLWGGYPWYFIAHPLVDSPLGILATPASVAGVYFVSYLCATYCIALLLAIASPTKQARLRAGIIAGSFFVVWVGTGYLLIPSAPSDFVETLSVGVIQPNVPQDNRSDWTVRQRVRDWYTLRDLTFAATSDPKNPERPDVIIWPEGFVPGWTFDPLALETERSAELVRYTKLQDPSDVPELVLPSSIPVTMIVDNLLGFQEAIDIPMVVGSVAYDNLRIVDTPNGIEYKRDAMYNSAFVVRDGRVDPVWYDKMHLTPFGEVMPYISKWPWLERNLLSFGAQGMEFGLSEGRTPRLLTVPIERGGVSSSVMLATPICFEATISSVCRKLVFDHGNRRAGVMVNMTNDGWFGSSDAGRTSHLLGARWRCIELNTPMVRCANTGISCVITHRGVVQSRAITPMDDIVGMDETDDVDPDPRQGYLIADVVVGQGSTLYARIGDVFGWVCLFITLVWTFMMIFQRSSGVSLPKPE